MLDPQRAQRVLPTRDFPPKIVELHKQISDELVGKPTSTLNIDSVPSGAVVVFNGSEVGKTPMQIKDVPAGQHFLVLDLAGYQIYAAPIQVNAGPQNFITPLKEKNIFHTYAANADQNSKDELKKLAEALGANVLILGQAIPKGSNLEVQTQIFTAKTGTFSEVYKESTGNKKISLQSTTAKVKKQLLESQQPTKVVPVKEEKKNKIPEPENKTEAPVEKNDTELTVDKPKKESPTPIKESLIKNSSSSKTNSQIAGFDEPSKKLKAQSSESPFYKKGWFWGVVGAIAVGAGAYFLLFNKDDPATSNVVNITNPL